MQNQPASWQANNPYATFGMSVADAPSDERAAFVRKTYLHLMGAVYAFAALEWAILSSGVMENVMPHLAGRWSMLLVFAGFIAVSWVANYWARSGASLAMQYAGLSLYVVAEAVIFAPLLYFAQSMAMDVQGWGEVNVIAAAGFATLIMFGALTAIAWTSGADFSFLRTALGIGAIAAFALILASFIFGMNLGVWFSVAIIVLACGYILYDTSNVMHHYQPGQHVSASLELFASVALLFWYVLRLFMSFSNRD